MAKDAKTIREELTRPFAPEDSGMADTSDIER